MSILDWNKYPNFQKWEFDCKATGENEMEVFFLDKLQELRTLFNQPMIISSGYRSLNHPIEAAKKVGGYHSRGVACDVAVSGFDALKLACMAKEMGFAGIRISQNVRSGFFIHLDLRNGEHFGTY